MAGPLRILTFNWHEAYLHLLSKISSVFDVVQKRKAGLYGWIKAFRPVPPNMRLVHARVAQENLRAGAYDRVIAHNFQDLLAVRDCGVPVVLVFHNKLTTEIALSRRSVDRQEYLGKAERLIRSVPDLRLVFVSPTKQIDWGLEGRVILPGIDPGDYSGYVGDEPRVLRVGNGLKERDLMLGWSVQERILEGLPSTVVGLNPTLPGSILPESWDAFRALLVHHRVFLNTTLPPYEDGYNLAMIEAMATGMPVVSIANPSSPIEDGVNGFVSEDEKALRERILELLQDRERAFAIGRKARETVLERFPINRFVAEWRDVLEGGHSSRVLPANRPTRAPRAQQKPRVLLSYTANPQTTGTYLERGLRSLCDVLTYGPAIGEEILKQWALEKIRGRLYEHDLPYSTADVGQVLEQLPAEWKPDLFLWVESGVSYPLRGFSTLSCPTACWLIDTHIHFERHLEIAESFDFVFLAQKKYVPLFQQAGIREAHWLPLACDPDIHRDFGLEPLYDISFVGSLTPAHRKRSELLMRLSQRFSVHVERCFLEEMALVLSRSRIVFNSSVRGDLNMRVFEALCTGSLLVTDEAAGSGLEELFEDGWHLVIYRSPEELEERAAYFLAHEEERATIAHQGMQEARARHTYAHRAAAILERVGLREHGSQHFDPARNGYRIGCGRQDDRIAQAVAEIYAREGKSKAAFQHFSEALSINPENAESLKGMLSTASSDADRAEAIRWLETYLALHPADLELTLRHAELCLQAGRVEDSRRSVERILLFEPNHQGARKIADLVSSASREHYRFSDGNLPFESSELVTSSVQQPGVGSQEAPAEKYTYGCIKADLTNPCNLRCPFCINDWRKVGPRMDIEEKTFSKLTELIPLAMDEGFFFSCFFEPTIHPRFISFIEKVPPHLRKKVFFTTNLSSEISVETFHRLSQAHLNHINISLDTLEPHTFETLRRGGMFRVFSENLKNLISIFRRTHNAPRIRYITMVLRQNLREIPELLEIARDEYLADTHELRAPFSPSIRHFNKAWAAASLVGASDWAWLTSQVERLPFSVTIFHPPSGACQTEAPSIGATYGEGPLDVTISSDGRVLVHGTGEVYNLHEIESPYAFFKLKLLTLFSMKQEWDRTSHLPGAGRRQLPDVALTTR